MKKCYYCDDEFLTDDEMNQHLVADHGDQFQMGSAQLGEIAGRQIFAGRVQTAVSVAAQLTSIYFQGGEMAGTAVEEIMKIHGLFTEAVMKQMDVDELTADLQTFLSEASTDPAQDSSEG